MNISIKNLNLTYPGGKKALQDVSLEMQSPNLIGLVGPNGAGKSTLLKLMVAAMLPSSGEIHLNGINLRDNEKVLKAALGYLPQSYGLYDELTVWQFLDYMSALKGITNSKVTIEKAIIETNLDEKRNARIGTLSGGQRQRVGIAQALLNQPQLLILDEPTVGLDPEERINFRNLFSRAAQDKIVLLSTHIIEDIQSVCNRLIVLNHGRIIFDGMPAALIRLAQGHVGLFDELPHDVQEQAYHVTARINTAHGVSCRVVAENMPEFARSVEPTLEDAYMYLLHRKELS